MGTFHEISALLEVYSLILKIIHIIKLVEKNLGIESGT